MPEAMRAFHFDLKRAMWRRDYMDAMADSLSGWGFNTIVYELEDKLRFAKHPTLAHSAAWSREDTASFARDCRARGLEVIPLVQSLGHAEYVVGRPEYAHLREAPDIADQYDPLSEEARAVIIDLFDEAIDVFQPTTYFHMGGDETWSLGKSRRCEPVVREIGVGGLYLRHMMPLFQHLRDRGLRPIIWADIVLTHPEIISDLPDWVVMIDWDYWTREQRPSSIQVWGTRPAVTWKTYADRAPAAWRDRFERYAVDDRARDDGTFRSFFYTDALREAGLEVLTASSARCYGDMVGTPANEVHWPNAFYAARAGARADGTLVTSWAVRHNHPELSLPAAFAASKGAAGETDFDPAAVGREFAADSFGADMPEFASAAYDRASTAIDLGQAHQLLAARAKLRSGEDPLGPALAGLERSAGGHEEAVARVESALEDYLASERSFAEMRLRAETKAHAFDFWIEGARLNAFYADFLLAALTGRLPENAGRLLTRLSEMRDWTRQLFSETYEQASVEDELDLRYGFHEEYLQGLARVS